MKVAIVKGYISDMPDMQNRLILKMKPIKNNISCFMKKILTAFLVFVSVLSQAQDYFFIPESYSKIDKFAFNNLLQKDKKPTLSYLLENGKLANETFFDSIKKVGTADKLEQLFYADTIENKAIIITRLVSDKEQKERNQKFFKLQKDDKKFKRNLKGSIVEKLNLTDLKGNNYSIESLKGKIIVLNFWFTNCAPCIKEMPDLNKMKEKYAKEDIMFFAITFNKKALVTTFLEKTKLDFIIIPNDQATIDDFQIKFFPTNILINKDGKVEFINETFVSNGIEIINKKIEKLIKN